MMEPYTEPNFCQRYCGCSPDELLSWQDKVSGLAFGFLAFLVLLGVIYLICREP